MKDIQNSIGNSEYSILKNSKNLIVETYPFPHIVIQDPLNEMHADQLTKEFPISEFNLQKNNYREDISANSLVDFPNISQTWKNFIQFHCSRDFFIQLTDLFKEYLPYSNLKNQKIDQYNTGIRFTDLPSEYDILLDAQISVNTPVTHSSSVRKIHVDNSNKLFSGLLYLRQSDDGSEGGNLQLFSWKKNYPEKKKLKLYQEGVDEKYCRLVKEIPYQNNICILFINSLDALHSVSIREETEHVRTFVNFVGELPYDFFTKHSFIERQFLYLKKILIKIRNFIRQLPF